jgi:hypothetical protein
MKILAMITFSRFKLYFFEKIKAYIIPSKQTYSGENGIGRNFQAADVEKRMHNLPPDKNRFYSIRNYIFINN